MHVDTPVCSRWCKSWLQDASSVNKPQVTLSNRFQLENRVAQESTSFIQSIRSYVWAVLIFETEYGVDWDFNQHKWSAPNHSGNALSNRLSSLLPTWRLLFRHVSTREESIFEFPPFGNLRSSSAAKMSAASTPSSDVSSIHSWYLLGLDTIWRLFQSIFP